MRFALFNSQTDVTDPRKPLTISESVGAPLLEVCVETLPEALQAVAAGADRLEVCAAMSESGTTPSIGLVEAILEHVKVPVFVMIRPRGGDFLYSAGEIDVMLRDIEAARASGAHGIVSGALDANGTIDQEGTEALLEAAAPLPFTFHRAFDMTRDLDESLDVLMAIGASRVLTSGGAETALAGVPVLSRLCVRAGQRLVIIAGGGVRSPHIAAIAANTGVREFHIGARKLVQTRMRYRPSAARVNKEMNVEEGEWFETDSAELAASVAALRGP